MENNNETSERKAPNIATCINGYHSKEIMVAARLEFLKLLNNYEALVEALKEAQRLLQMDNDFLNSPYSVMISEALKNLNE